MKKKVVIPIVVCIILLVVSIGGNLRLWTSLNQANSEITSLETTVYTKSSEIESLKDENTWLKQHSFTYYMVGDAINISNVEFVLTGGLLMELSLISATNL